MLTSRSKLTKSMVNIISDYGIYRHYVSKSHPSMQLPMSPADHERQQVLQQVMNRDHTKSQFEKIAKALDPGIEELPAFMSWTKQTFSLANIRKTIQLAKCSYEISKQKYSPERSKILGNDIGAAHFIVCRDGAVKFQGHNEWISRNPKDDIEEYSKHLPKQFDPSYFVESIDASNMKIYYEGFQNLQDLKRLKWLSVKNNPVFDDWCLDRICYYYSKNLEYLDISDCQLLTYRGLAAIYKLEKLTTLVVNNISSSNKFQLSCLMLEDLKPDLKIVGVDYIKIGEQQKCIEDK